MQARGTDSQWNLALHDRLLHLLDEVGLLRLLREEFVADVARVICSYRLIAVVRRHPSNLMPEREPYELRWLIADCVFDDLSDDAAGGIECPGDPCVVAAEVLSSEEDVPLAALGNFEVVGELPRQERTVARRVAVGPQDVRRFDELVFHLDQGIRSLEVEQCDLEPLLERNGSPSSRVRQL